MGKELEKCPHCGVNLVGLPIPKEYIDRGFYRPETTHYSRIVAIYDIWKDRTVAYQCPDCKKEL